ncbi:hypothetical protein BDD14_5717 [Edaphobacter modestus]|uniref:Uncharacterized protein n=1 Tax=Edaphobacter modestus TaxID=388466 RepID=A0A4Q7YG65_9BACT|nr:hypothetical protein BDD14_5717 [Edaphobacter modestus]
MGSAPVIAFPLNINRLTMMVYSFLRSFWVYRWYVGTGVAVLIGIIVCCRRKGLALVPVALFAAFIVLYALHIRSFYEMRSPSIDPQCSSIHVMTPMWARPNAPPPSRTSPSFGCTFSCLKSSWECTLLAAAMTQSVSHARAPRLFMIAFPIYVVLENALTAAFGPLDRDFSVRFRQELKDLCPNPGCQKGGTTSNEENIEPLIFI